MCQVSSVGLRLNRNYEDGLSGCDVLGDASHI